MRPIVPPFAACVCDPWPLPSEDPDQRDQRQHVAPARVASQPRHPHQPDAKALGQVVHVALVGLLSAANEGGAITTRIELLGQIDRLDGRPADVQPGNDAHDADRVGIAGPIDPRGCLRATQRGCSNQARYGSSTLAQLRVILGTGALVALAAVLALALAALSGLVAVATTYLVGRRPGHHQAQLVRRSGSKCS